MKSTEEFLTPYPMCAKKSTQVAASTMDNYRLG